MILFIALLGLATLPVIRAEIDACVSFPCATNATCTDIISGDDDPATNATTGRTCACEFGFEGNGEPGNCTIQNFCLTDDVCDGNATCTPILGSARCTCNAGFEGMGEPGQCTRGICNTCNLAQVGDQIRIAIFSNTGCQNCVRDSTNLAACAQCCQQYNTSIVSQGVCPNLWIQQQPLWSFWFNVTGKLKMDCAPFFGLPSTTCSNPCLPATCTVNNSVCVWHPFDETNDLTECVCKSGYQTIRQYASGTVGDVVECRDINECAASTYPCANNATTTCTNTPGSFTCACRDGFSGNPALGGSCIPSKCTDCPAGTRCDFPGCKAIHGYSYPAQNGPVSIDCASCLPPSCDYTGSWKNVPDQNAKVLEPASSCFLPDLSASVQCLACGSAYEPGTDALLIRECRQCCNAMTVAAAEPCIWQWWYRSEHAKTYTSVLNRLMPLCGPTLWQDNAPNINTSCADQCFNKVQDGAESDIDCGGGCFKCLEGLACSADKDCKSGFCNAKKCAVKPAAAFGEEQATVLLAVVACVGTFFGLVAYLFWWGAAMLQEKEKHRTHEDDHAAAAANAPARIVSQSEKHTTEAKSDDIASPSSAALGATAVVGAAAAATYDKEKDADKPKEAEAAAVIHYSRASSSGASPKVEPAVAPKEVPKVEDPSDDVYVD